MRGVKNGPSVCAGVGSSPSSQLGVGARVVGPASDAAALAEAGAAAASDLDGVDVVDVAVVLCPPVEEGGEDASPDRPVQAASASAPRPQCSTALRGSRRGSGSVAVM